MSDTVRIIEIFGKGPAAGRFAVTVNGWQKFETFKTKGEAIEFATNFAHKSDCKCTACRDEKFLPDPFGV